jgi:hypothetical protein
MAEGLTDIKGRKKLTSLTRARLGVSETLREFRRQLGHETKIIWHLRNVRLGVEKVL